MMNEECKPINRENLDGVVTKLKKVLNPAITEQEYFGYGIKLITDIPFNVLDLEQNTTDIVSFSIKCATGGVDPKTIYCIGYIQDISLNTVYCATNLGSARIQQIGITVEDENLCLILIPNTNITKTEAEVFLSDTNKNHVSSIEYLEEEYTGTLIEITSGESISGFEYIIRNTEDDYTVLQNGRYVSEPIDTIYHSVDATLLTHPIEIEINGVDENDNQIITGSAQLSTEENTSTTIDLNVDLGDIEETITNNILDNFPVATDQQIGGIALAGNLTLGENQIPVETTIINDLPRAYVDLSDANINVEGETDIHRFAVLPTDLTEAGTNLIQYIGPTTPDHIFGYYYLWVPTIFNVSSISDGWSEIREESQGISGTRIAEYNRDNDFILKVNDPVVITLTDTLTDGDPIQNSTLFSITQGNTFSDSLTYSDIIYRLGFELSNGFITYDSSKDYDLTLSLTTDTSAWRQKNVQPMVKVGSPLTFKGTATWAELQSYSPTAEVGDFYIVSDKANQEYYWTGDHWEFMGDIFDPYEAGDGINITSANEISVRYDGNSILIGDDGLQVSPSLYVSESDNISVEEKDEDGRVISVLGYKWDPDQKSFAEGKFSNSTDTPAQGSYSHTEGRDTKTEGQASHAEGYNTIAYGKASHAEGFGILFNTGSSGFSWEEIEDPDSDLKITIATQNGASQKTILTLIRELYFINDKGFNEKEIYSRETKLKSGFSIEHLEINGTEFDPTDPYSDPQNPITNGEIFLSCYDTSILIDGGTLDIIVPVYSSNLSSHAEGKNTEAVGKNSHAEGLVNKTEGENSHVEGHLNYIGLDGYNAHAEGYNTRALKNQAHSEGANTQAYGENSHVEGEETCAWGKDSHAEGKSSNSPALDNDSYFNDNSKDNIYNAWKLSQGYGEDEYACAWALASHIEGKDNLAVGNNSHAEGQDTCAYGDKAHAEGSSTLAQGNNSHAEGDDTEAIGMSSHAEGYYTRANGNLSHTEGWVTIANNQYEHAEGSYNVSHKASDTYGNAGNTQHSVGIGYNLSTSKNAFEIMQNGDTYIYGIGGYQGTSVLSPVKTILSVISVLSAGNVPVGSIQMYAGNTTPTGWLLCNGSAISRSSYADLFTVIGTTYGTGDGSTTFNLPNLSGRFPLGVGESSEAGHTNHSLASNGGEEKHTLVIAEMPSHSHEMLQGGAVTPDELGEGLVITTTAATVTESKYIDVNNADTNFIKSTGMSTEHNNMPPFLTLNFIIKY